MSTRCSNSFFWLCLLFLVLFVCISSSLLGVRNNQFSLAILVDWWLKTSYFYVMHLNPLSSSHIITEWDSHTSRNVIDGEIHFIL